MPARAASELEVANLALTEGLGLPPIASFDDPTARARVVKSLFGSVRDRVLRAHDWNFAAAWVKPAMDPVPSLNPRMPNRFALPDDCLRVRFVQDMGMEQWTVDASTINPGDTPVEVMMLVTAETAPLVCYTRRIEYPRLWDAQFISAFADELAGAAAAAISKDISAGDKLKARAGGTIEQATVGDAREMSPRHVSKQTSWVRARYVGVQIGEFRGDSSDN